MCRTCEAVISGCMPIFSMLSNGKCGSPKPDPLSFSIICAKLRRCRKNVLEPLLELAVEIAREGREGRRIGTLFTLGDAEAVMAWSRPLILNPLEGHPGSIKRITSSNLW